MVKMSSSTVSNSEIALSLYTLFISSDGERVFKDVLRRYSKTLLKKLDNFVLKLEKEGYFTKFKDFNKSQLLSELNKFKIKVQNVDDDDVNEIREIIKKRYFIGDQLAIEGFLYGIYDWIKNFFVDYYSLIKKQQYLDLKNKTEESILKKIPKELLQSRERIIKTFGSELGNKKTTITFFEGVEEKKKTVGLRSITEETPSELRSEIIQANTTILRPSLSVLTINPKTNAPEINDKLLRAFFGFKVGESNRTYNREKERIEKNIDNTAEAIQLRQRDFDKEIYVIIERVILKLLTILKDLYPKQLKDVVRERLTKK
jgi:hypothetical protein